MNLKRLLLVFAVASVLVLAPSVNATEDEDLPQTLRDITNRFNAFMAPLTERFVFGPRDAVRDWVRKARDTIEEQFNRARQRINEPIGRHIGTHAETPMNGWAFKLPSQFASLSYQEMQQRLFGAIPETNFNRPGWVRAETTDLMLQLDDLEIPESYTFFQKFPACQTWPWNQFYCGSCWAYAALGSLGHRICRESIVAGKKVPELFRLSTQAVLSCIPESMAKGGGCKGANTYSSSQFISKMKIPEFKDMLYSSDSGNPQKQLCSSVETKKPLYGPQSGEVTVLSTVPADQREKAIQAHIMREGPVVAVFRVPEEFMGYRGHGVFQKSENGKFVGEGTVNSIHTYHAVSIHGWGVLNGVKYWHIENSWGSPYDSMPMGQFQFFRYLRGVDHCGMESLTVLGIRASASPNFPSSGAPAAPPDAPPLRPPQELVQGECASDWSNGYCVRECLSGNRIFSPTKQNCSNGLVCCKKPSSVPETLCERDFRGASCMNVGQCSAQGRSHKKGLCPGDSTISCCLPKGISANALAGAGNSPYKFSN